MLASTATRDPTTTEGRGVQPISLAPGSTANFRVSMLENGATPCATIGAFHLTPPNAFSYVQVSVTPRQQGGYCGNLHIQPTQAGPTP